MFINLFRCSNLKFHILLSNNFITLNMNPTHYPSLYISPVTTVGTPINNIQSLLQYDNDASTNTQPNIIGQAVQVIQDYQASRISLPINLSQTQGIVMAEYSFFYKT